MSGLAATLTLGAAQLLARLPLRLAHAIGFAAGWVAYLTRRKFKRRLLRNLRQAALTTSDLEFEALRKRVIAEQGKCALELPLMWMRSSEALTKLVRSVEGAQYVEAARAAGRGIIFITPHLGNFEMAGRYVASMMPVTFLYRPPRVAWVEPIMIRGRQRDNASMAPANTRGVRMMLRALRQGGAIGILPDQAPAAGEGVWADFFGRKAYTMTLIARLQQTTGASVIPFYAERLESAEGYAIIFGQPIYLQGYTPEEGATALNLAVEQLIRRCPAQYLWSYNRYKRPRDLDDLPSPPSLPLAAEIKIADGIEARGVDHPNGGPRPMQPQ